MWRCWFGGGGSKWRISGLTGSQFRYEVLCFPTCFSHPSFSFFIIFFIVFMIGKISGQTRFTASERVHLIFNRTALLLLPGCFSSLTSCCSLLSYSRRHYFVSSIYSLLVLFSNIFLRSCYVSCYFRVVFRLWSVMRHGLLIVTISVLRSADNYFRVVFNHCCSIVYYFRVLFRYQLIPFCTPLSVLLHRFLIYYSVCVSSLIISLLRSLINATYPDPLNLGGI